MPEQPKRETLPTETWVFTEHCQLDEGGAGVVFRVLESKTSTTLGTLRTFGGKKFRGVRPGAVYTIECDEKSCLPSTLHYVGEFADKEQARVWEANDAARKAENQRKKLLADSKKKSALVELLDPLKKVYSRCPNRTALELLILRYLRHGDLS